MTTILDPTDERVPVARQITPRTANSPGVIGLLDISKPGGNLFLDRMEQILRERYGVAEVVRARKPTFAKVAPPPVIEQLRSMDAVIEALAD